MKAVELAESQKGSWRNISITLIDTYRSMSANACESYQLSIGLAKQVL